MQPPGDLHQSTVRHWLVFAVVLLASRMPLCARNPAVEAALRKNGRPFIEAAMPLLASPTTLNAADFARLWVAENHGSGGHRLSERFRSVSEEMLATADFAQRSL
jgi:hypothetical protein